VLAFAVIAQTERRTNMGESPGTSFRAYSQLSGNRSLMFACLRMNLFRFASESAVDPGRKFNRCRQRRRRSYTQFRDRFAARSKLPLAGQRALANSRRLRPIRRAPIGTRQMAAVIAQLSVSVPVNTIAAFAVANNGAWSNMYCSQITKT